MPLQSTSGAASYDAFGGGVPVVPKYIEEYFSTFLYSGNAGTQTVTNGIDLSTKGGMVWIKSRSGAYPHSILDTVRGFNYSGTQTKRLDPSTTDSQADAAGNATQASPLTDGFSVTTSGGGAINFYNASGQTYTSWSWAKAPKFFDVVTYTGNGAAPRNISHNLGSTPGCILIKCTNTTGDWFVWHRSMTSTTSNYLVLNSTAAQASGFYWPNGVTDTFFSVNGTLGNINTNGNTYVAYLFAHNAGGFGLTGTDNVISCGSYTGTGSTSLNVNLGYEPQWVMIKNSTTNASATGWYIQDNMRGMTASTDNNGVLYANLSSAEAQKGSHIVPTATGFTCSASDADFNDSGTTYIYIAIRRGPMKVPTSGTSVFNPVLASSTAPALRSSNFTSGVDSGIRFYTAGYTGYPEWSSRLTGTGVLGTSGTAAESTLSVNTWDYMNGYLNYAGLGTDFGSWMFKRAPSFFDEVCYTGTGSALSVTHNLGAVPELMIVKRRSAAGNWQVYSAALGNGYKLAMNETLQALTTSIWNSTTPTSTQFRVSSDLTVGGNGSTYVAYLFATCAGVSKVGSYTGTGTTLQVNCGFTAGARFVLIKRTDSTGDWYVWDSARGIVSGNDPYLLLNSTAAEVTSTDYIDTYSAGFEISSTAPAAINANGGTFIFFAVA